RGQTPDPNCGSRPKSWSDPNFGVAALPGARAGCSPRAHALTRYSNRFGTPSRPTRVELGVRPRFPNSGSDPNFRSGCPRPKSWSDLNFGSQFRAALFEQVQHSVEADVVDAVRGRRAHRGLGAKGD